MSLPTIATTDQEIAHCFPVILELRPHLEAGTFVELVRKMQSEGFQLAFIEEAGSVVAVAGFRMTTSLFMGKNLYVDDLVTASAYRSKGYGEKLLGWLRTIAADAGCTHLHLDSGTQRTRAHRFYLSQGLDIKSFHFSEELDSD